MTRTIDICFCEERFNVFAHVFLGRCTASGDSFSRLLMTFPVNPFTYDFSRLLIAFIFYLWLSPDFSRLLMTFPVYPFIYDFSRLLRTFPVYLCFVLFTYDFSCLLMAFHFYFSDVVLNPASVWVFCKICILTWNKCLKLNVSGSPSLSLKPFSWRNRTGSRNSLAAIKALKHSTKQPTPKVLPISTYPDDPLP